MTKLTCHPIWKIPVLTVYLRNREKVTFGVNGQIKSTQSQYDALQREIIETEQDLKKLEKKANQSVTVVQKIAAFGKKLKTVGDNISSVSQKLLPVKSIMWSTFGEMSGKAVYNVDFSGWLM